jgi:hypothetical protein
MGRAGRHPLWLAAAGLLLGLGGARAAAQATPPSWWGLQPVYSSTYDVRRQEIDWWQKFAINRRGGLADVQSALEIKNAEDKTRNDYREADNRYGLQLARTSGLGQLAFDGGSRRRWNQDTRSLTVMDEDHVNLSDKVPLLARTGKTMDLSLGGGWLKGREVKDRKVGTTSTSDRTSTSGWEGESRLGGEWAPRSDFKLGGAAAWDGSLQSSRSRHIETEATTPYAATDHSRTLDFSTTLEWTRYKMAQISLDAGYTDGFAQYYQATQEAQETKSRIKRTLEVKAEGEPDSSFAYAVDVLTDLHSFDYRIEPNDKSESNRTGRFSAQYRPHLPLLGGSELTGALELGSRRTVNQNTPDYDTREKSLEGQFSRPFGPRFTVQLRGTAVLTQDFYDDGSLDKDRLRTDSFFSLRYDRGDPFAASASYAASETRDVNIPRLRASQNQVTDDYRITFDYQARLAWGISLRQNYQISATYTYYVFSEAKNTLTRTNRVTTKIDVPLWPTSSLYLEHIYNRSDNGLYTYSASGGNRAYAIGAENLRQYIQAVAQYQLFGMIQLKATQSFNIETRETRDGNPGTRREKLTFAGLVALHRQVRGIDLDASFERTSSNTEEDFWTINASLEKRFD